MPCALSLAACVCPSLSTAALGLVRLSCPPPLTDLLRRCGRDRTFCCGSATSTARRATTPQSRSRRSRRTRQGSVPRPCPLGRLGLASRLWLLSIRLCCAHSAGYCHARPASASALALALPVTRPFSASKSSASAAPRSTPDARPLSSLQRKRCLVCFVCGCVVCVCVRGSVCAFCASVLKLARTLARSLGGASRSRRSRS